MSTTPVSSSLGKPQRVHSSGLKEKENSVSRKNEPSSKAVKERPTTPVAAQRPQQVSSKSKQKRPTAVQRAQEEALRAFGGKSLGNVLEDVPTAPVAAPAPVSNAKVVSRLEQAKKEAEAAFAGVSFDELTERIKETQKAAAARNNSNAIEERPRPLSRIEQAKLEAAKVWEADDLGKLDIKPPLSRMELEILEMRARQGAKTEEEIAREQEEKRQAEEERKRIALEEAREAEERRQRDEEREKRRLEQKRKEELRLQKYQEARKQREKAKMAPFMQLDSVVNAAIQMDHTDVVQEKGTENAKNQVVASTPIIAAPTQAPIIAAPEPAPIFAAPAPAQEEIIISAPTVVSAPATELSSVAAAPIAAPVAPSLIPAPVITLAPATSSVSKTPGSGGKIVSIVSVSEDAIPDACEKDEEEEDESKYTFVTAPSSPVATNIADATVLSHDTSMSELLEGISITGLSDEFESPALASGTDRESIAELSSTLQKNRTPLLRLPFHEKHEMDSPLKSAVQEVIASNGGRSAAMLESMRESLNGHTVKDLKEELRSRGLKVSGKKEELVDRLIEWHQQNGNDKNSCNVM